MSAWFVTGTDTGCGKTAVSVALVQALKASGTAVGYKPVAAGCEMIDGWWQNEDALALQAVSDLAPAYERINPYALPAAIAPHVAAEQQGLVLSLDEIRAGFESLQADYDHVVVEGAGGWRVPLHLQSGRCFSEIPSVLRVPVILVVGVKLGCINHATLTAEQLVAAGVPVAGWVANTVEPDMPAEKDNLETLKLILCERMKMPLIAQFGYRPNGQLPAGSINLAPLLRP
jgi:dethiobiotin synthetase